MFVAVFILGWQCGGWEVPFGFGRYFPLLRIRHVLTSLPRIKVNCKTTSSAVNDDFLQEEFFGDSWRMFTDLVALRYI